jgi:hypothetical protein
MNNFSEFIFTLEKVKKIIQENDKDLIAKDLWFTKFQNYFLKEKSVDYVNGAVHRVHGVGSRFTASSLNTSCSIMDARPRLEWRRGMHRT